jgi:hypothetical protein
MVNYPPDANPHMAQKSLETDPFPHEEPAPFMHLYKSGCDGQAFIDDLEAEEDIEWGWASTGGTARGTISLVRDSRTTDFETLLNSRIGSDFKPTQLTGFPILYQMERAVWDYRQTYDLQLSTNQSWSILKYGHGGQYLMHTDHGSNDPRLISVITYLNTVNSGGSTIFPYMDVQVEATEGDILIFPSSNPYSHLAEPAQDTKYVIVSFFL